MSTQKTLDLYKIINPSDDYTFRAPDDRVACAVGILLGNGQYPVERCDNQNDVGSLLLFQSEGQIAVELERIFGQPLSEYMETHAAEVSEALGSVLIGSQADRALFEAAIDMIPETDAKAKYAELWHDSKRSSMNDIGKRAAALAKECGGRLI